MSKPYLLQHGIIILRKRGRLIMQADLNKTKQPGHLQLHDKLENYNRDSQPQFASIYPLVLWLWVKNLWQLASTARGCIELTLTKT